MLLVAQPSHFPKQIILFIICYTYYCIFCIDGNYVTETGYIFVLESAQIMQKKIIKAWQYLENGIFNKNYLKSWILWTYRANDSHWNIHRDVDYYVYYYVVLL